MKKYRIKFAKLGKVKYIGHLDLLTLFQRAIKRARVPIDYSQGFNPHQLMSFAIPLSLGMESVGEYIDVQMAEEIAPEDIINKLNATMPQGLKLLEARELLDNEKNCASIIEAAIYEIELDRKIENINGIINEMLQSDEMLIERTSKRKTKEVDIKPDIFEMQEIPSEGNTKIRVTISTGSQRNLKPDLLLEYLYKYLGLEFISYKFKIKRIELLKTVDGKFVGL